MDKLITASCPACLGTHLHPYMRVTDHRASQEVFPLEQCTACGLVITQQQPLEEYIGRYYETDDYISHSEKGTTLMDRVYYVIRNWMTRRKQSWILQHANGRRLIDIGAGTGFFAAQMQNNGWQVRALEPSLQARAQALQVHGLKLEDVDALFHLPSRSADVITMWHVLEHVHSPEKYLLRIHEIIDDKGVLFLALPNYTSFDARWYGAYWGAWDVPRHLWHFSPRAINTLLDRTGFKLIKEYTLPFDAFYVSLISEKYMGGGLFRMIRALIIGKWSFLLSLFNKEKASSIVYVCQKST